MFGIIYELDDISRKGPPSVDLTNIYSGAYFTVCNARTERPYSAFSLQRFAFLICSTAFSAAAQTPISIP